jgi:hypothetical protein
LPAPLDRPAVAHIFPARNFKVICNIYVRIQAARHELQWFGDTRHAAARFGLQIASSLPFAVELGKSREELQC